jgi:hypothetical protein
VVLLAPLVPLGAIRRSARSAGTGGPTVGLRGGGRPDDTLALEAASRRARAQERLAPIRLAAVQRVVRRSASQPGCFRTSGCSACDGGRDTGSLGSAIRPGRAARDRDPWRDRGYRTGRTDRPDTAHGPR